MELWGWGAGRKGEISIQNIFETWISTLLQNLQNLSLALGLHEVFN
jgi:hypothetical protein